MSNTELIKHDGPQALPSNRKFGMLFVIVFSIIGAWPKVFSEDGQLIIWGFAVALAFLTFVVVAPDMLQPLNKIWMKLAELLHSVVSPIVLGVVFFGVVTPIGIFMRMRGADPLRLKKDAEAGSYWIERSPPGPKPETLPRQF